MRWQVLILKVFWRASRSRRDCGNLEAAIVDCVLFTSLQAAVAATAGILRRKLAVRYSGSDL